MDYLNPNSKKPVPMSGVVDGVLKKLGLARKFQESQIKADWTKWVGDSVAQHTTPYRVINKKLVIYVDNSVWLAELNRFYKKTILRRVQKEVGKDLIEEIIFKIGEAPIE